MNQFEKNLDKILDKIPEYPFIAKEILGCINVLIKSLQKRISNLKSRFRFHHDGHSFGSIQLLLPYPEYVGGTPVKDIIHFRFLGGKKGYGDFPLEIWFLNCKSSICHNINEMQDVLVNLINKNKQDIHIFTDYVEQLYYIEQLR